MTRTIRTALLALGFTALGAGIAATAPAAARGPGGPAAAEDCPCARGPMAARLADELGLTDEQAEALDDLRAEMRAFHRERRPERGGIFREAVEQAASGEEIDRKALHAAIDERARKRVEAAHELADRIADFLDTLSPEQRERLAKLVEERAPGPRGPRGGGR